MIGEPFAVAMILKIILWKANENRGNRDECSHEGDEGKADYADPDLPGHPRLGELDHLINHRREKDSWEDKPSFGFARYCPVVLSKMFTL